MGGFELYQCDTAGVVTILFVYAILLAIAWIDGKTQYIPPQLNFALAAVGVISHWTLPWVSVWERVIGACSIALPMALIVLAVPEGFGWGDIKLMAASGILLGWKGNVAAFFLGVLTGGAYGSYLLVTKKKGKKDQFAFGPFLAAGIAISLYGGLGQQVVNRYIEMVKEIIVLIH
jgi:leader peptidase (prepilin peptidase)/N-methyltransferase